MEFSRFQHFRGRFSHSTNVAREVLSDSEQSSEFFDEKLRRKTAENETVCCTKYFRENFR